MNCPRTPFPFALASTALCCALLAALLPACASKHTLDDTPNGYGQLYRETGSLIDTLGNSHGQLSDWERLARHSHEIRSHSALRWALRSRRPFEDELNSAYAKFDAAAKVRHLEYEGGFHAVVFFDTADHAQFVIRWQGNEEQ
jgi:hypothetical protein